MSSGLWRFLCKSGKFLLRDNFNRFDTLKLDDVVMLLEDEIIYEGKVLEDVVTGYCETCLGYTPIQLAKAMSTNNVWQIYEHRYLKDRFWHCRSFITPTGKTIILPLGDAARFFDPIENHE